MERRTVVLLVALACLAGARPGLAAVVSCSTGKEVQWTPASSGNGHFYQAVCNTLTWDQAEAAAEATGRHLATITSSAENTFAFNLIDDQSFWAINAFNCNIGPFFGAFQAQGASEPAEFSWVTGEPFSYTNWWPGEPNNSGGVEQKGSFFNCSGGAIRTSNWNDLGPSVTTNGYVTEWEHSLDIDGDGETEPLTDGLLILRRLFGFSGTALTTGAVDLVHCTRCDAAAIEPFVDLMKVGLVYDATADWSDSANPNGPWSYLEGTNALPHVASWQSSLGGYTMPQPGWARSENGNDRIPFFNKSLGFETAEHDFLAGDLVVHTWDAANGVGNGNARLRFTVPATGVYHTTLAIWIGREIGRSVDWTLALNDVSQASGNVASGDGFSRSSPNGTKKSLALAAGDHVDLKLDTASVSGDFVGLRLRFEAFGIDVDGDGETQPLIDGLLILRYLFGFTGDSLTAGAVDLVNCTRCDGTAVKAYLDGFD